MSEEFRSAVIVFTANGHIGEQRSTHERFKSFLENDCTGFKWIKPERLISYIDTGTNGHVVITLVPSGSKQGWPEDTEWLHLRGLVIDFARTFRYAKIISVEDSMFYGEHLWIARRIKSEYEEEHGP